MPANFPNWCCQCYCNGDNQIPVQAVAPFLSPNSNFCKCTSFTPRGCFPNDKVFLVCCNECVIRSPKNSAKIYKPSSSSSSSSSEDCCCCNNCPVCVLKRYYKATQRKLRNGTHESCFCKNHRMQNQKDNGDGRQNRSKRSRYKSKGHCNCVCRCKSENDIGDSSSLEDSSPRKKSHRRGRPDYKGTSEYEMDSTVIRSASSLKKRSRSYLSLGDRTQNSGHKKVVKPSSNSRTVKKPSKVKLPNAQSKSKTPSKKLPTEQKEKVKDVVRTVGNIIKRSSKSTNGSAKSKDKQAAKRTDNGRHQNTADHLRIRLEQRDQQRFQKEKPSHNRCKPCPCQQDCCRPCQIVIPPCPRIC